MVSSQTIVLVVLLVVDYVLITPFCCFLTYIYYKRRHYNVIHFRRPRVVVIANIIAIYFISIHGPLSIYLYIKFDGESRNERVLPDLFDSIGFESVFFAYFMRAYFIWYDYQVNKIRGDKVWKDLMSESKNNKENSIENNWFIKNRRKWGYTKWLRKVIIIFLVLYVILISLLSRFPREDYTEYVTGTLLTIILIPFLYVIYSVSQIKDDGIYLKNEILTQCFLLLFGCMSEILFVYLFKPARLYFEFLIPMLCVLGVILSSTVYVFDKYKFKRIQLNCKQLCSCDYDTTDTNEIVSTTKTNISANYSNTNTASPKLEYDIFTVMSSSTGLQAFSKHLVKEYAIENLV